MLDYSLIKFSANEAEKFIKDQGINSLPIDPYSIAKNLNIKVVAKPASAEGVSGMLIRVGEEYAIAYATHIKSEAFRRFSVAHELGHFLLPGHVEALLKDEDVHESKAGFISPNQYEREADNFAAALLMPDPMFTRELKKLDDGLSAVFSLADIFQTSLEATAIRYTEKTSVPVAVVVSMGPQIKYCFLSNTLKEFDGLNWGQKNKPLPKNSLTYEFNSETATIKRANKAEGETDLRDWFDGQRPIPGTEEVIRLGYNGRTLTLLTASLFADSEDEKEDLDDRWAVRFGR